ncbi:MAG: AsmA family protein [Rhodospirillales bacterium]|nr:AsmA family protein [Rhodospirillales bacterium]
MKRAWKILVGTVVVLAAVMVAGLAVLMSIDFNQYRGVIADQVKAATGRELKIAGDLKLQVSLIPSVAVSGASFANAPWGSRPEMAKVDRFAAEVELIPLLSGQIRVRRVVLSGLDLFLETDAKGRGNWQLEELTKQAQKPAPAPAEPSRAAPLPVVNEVRLKDIKVTYLDGAGKKETSLALKQLDVSAPAADAPLQVKLEGAYNQAAFQVDGRLGSLDDLVGGQKPFIVDLEATLLGAKASIKGTIAKALEGKGIQLALGVSGADLAKTVQAAADLAGTPAALQLPSGKAFNIAGSVNDKSNRYNVEDLQVKLGSSDLRGRIQAALSGQRPDIRAELQSDLLDLNELLPAKEKEKAAQKVQKTTGQTTPSDGRVLPNDPLPLDGLKAADAELAFKGKRFLYETYQADDIDLALTLKNGRLEIKPLLLTFGDGRISADVALDGSRTPPALAAKVALKHLDMAKLLKQLGQQPAVTGKIDVVADVRGNGRSVRALMAGLDGTARIVSKDGTIEVGAVNIVSADALSVLPFFKSEGDKDLRCIVANFDVQRGQAAGKTILLETGGLAVVGTGGVNLADETLDLTFDPRAKKVSLVKLAEVPMKVGGTFASPSVRPALVESVVAKATDIVSGVAGLARGGISGAIDTVTKKKIAIVDETDYCALAFAGKPLLPAGQPAATAPRALTDPKKDASPVEGVVKGVGDALKGIFSK